MKKITPPINPLKRKLKHMILSSLARLLGIYCSKPYQDILTKYKFKKVAFFCTAGGGPGKIFEEMQGLAKKPVATLCLLKREVVADQHVQRLRNSFRNVINLLRCGISSR